MEVQAEDIQRQLRFLKFCFWLGVVADALASLLLIFPPLGEAAFGVENLTSGEYLYVSRVAAALMLGWTGLLAWGSRDPVERRALLLLTVAPVVLGLAAASLLAVGSGFVEARYMLPLWVFYALLIPLYLVAYGMAGRIAKNRDRHTS